jgi:glyoxylate/hydroxypyruvate reductase A
MARCTMMPHDSLHHDAQADPQMGARLATWVVWGVINHQRKMDAYLAAQRASRWDLAIEDKGSSLLDNHNITVGILGFGTRQH